ncbi:hypothetical protein [Acetobacter syzygii]|nr:hypothetical protein [Acetobacter syzygii]GAN70656.1 hypothetical protein Absy_008_169 [Acetobacter syzygii]GEL55457.1 hypothetical protein ASY01nite_05230 [Acetobacter syzygii]
MTVDFECGMVLGGSVVGLVGVALAVALRLLARHQGSWPGD